jgi:hypothetical protein
VKATARRPVQFRPPWSSSFTRRALLARQSYAIQTVGSLTPASSSPQRRSGRSTMECAIRDREEVRALVARRVGRELDVPALVSHAGDDEADAGPGVKPVVQYRRHPRTSWPPSQMRSRTRTVDFSCSAKPSSRGGRTGLYLPWCEPRPPRRRRPGSRSSRRPQRTRRWWESALPCALRDERRFVAG